MKLSEEVEWLERNYDRYILSSTPPQDGLCTVHWVSPPDEPSLRWQDFGRGPGHHQPMFTMKYDNGGSYADTYWWQAADFIPLSLASEVEPL